MTERSRYSLCSNGPLQCGLSGPGGSISMRAIEIRRTATLGGHVDQCGQCGKRRIRYDSCRNRHCPTCGSLARARWLCRRRGELLPVHYFHVVFTLPSLIADLALQNKKALYDLHVLTVTPAGQCGWRSCRSGAGPILPDAGFDERRPCDLLFAQLDRPVPSMPRVRLAGDHAPIVALQTACIACPFGIENPARRSTASPNRPTHGTRSLFQALSDRFNTHTPLPALIPRFSSTLVLTPFPAGRPPSFGRRTAENGDEDLCIHAGPGLAYLT